MCLSSFSNYLKKTCYNTLIQWGKQFYVKVNLIPFHFNFSYKTLGKIKTITLIIKKLAYQINLSNEKWPELTLTF